MLDAEHGPTGTTVVLPQSHKQAESHSEGGRLTVRDTVIYVKTVRGTVKYFLDVTHKIQYIYRSPTVLVRVLVVLPLSTVVYTDGGGD